VTGYLGGAVVTYVRIGDPSFVLPFGFGVVARAGFYVRDERLHALLPLRRGAGPHWRALRSRGSEATGCVESPSGRIPPATLTRRNAVLVRVHHPERFCAIPIEASGYESTLDFLTLFPYQGDPRLFNALVASRAGAAERLAPGAGVGTH
jgi:hypothetical protein